MGDDEDAVYLSAQQQLYHRLFLPQIRAGVAEHDVIAVGAGADLRMVSQLRHELVVHRRHHQTDQVGALGDHGAGDKVGGIAHFVAQLQYPLSGFTADLRAAGEGAGNRGIGNAGCLGHVF